MALLRAVNLGSRNQVSMPKLRTALETAGFADVRTYVQSGNVVAASRHRKPDAVARAITTVIRTEFGLDVPVVVRTYDELTGVVAANPFPQAAKERPKQLSVTFLEAEPDAAKVEALLAGEATADTCRVIGRELYVDYLGGMAGTRLTPQYFESRLGVRGTARNWRTVLAITEMAGATAS